MLKTIDLFAGCGGLTDGFEQSNQFKVQAAVEWDKNAADVLRHRLGDKWNYQNAATKVVHFDIQRTEELINGFSNDPEYGSSLGLERLADDGKTDVVIGGPPCQAYSVAGRIRDKNGMQNDYRNFLFESYIKVVNRFKPKACIFENVQGMLSASPGGISIIERVTEAFDNAGYFISSDLRKEALYNTAEFDVPQKRFRVIIIAVRKSEFRDYRRVVRNFYNELN